MNKATAIAILQSRLRQLNKEKRQEIKVQSTIGTGESRPICPPSLSCPVLSYLFSLTKLTSH
jgi:hypothetical protein